MSCSKVIGSLVLLSWVFGNPTGSIAAEIVLLPGKADPYGYPRPAPGARHVPLHTSLFFQVGFRDQDTEDTVLTESLSVRLRAEASGTLTGTETEVLSPGQQFAEDWSGHIAPSRKPQSALAVYLDSACELRPGTTYRVLVTARSRAGLELNGAPGSWEFTTSEAELTAPHRLDFALDLAAPPVGWEGGFFTGFCKPSFCTSSSNRMGGYELMNRVRAQTSQRAWSLQRDFSPTSFGHQPEFLNWSHPNVVRERETRRIVAIEPHTDGMLVRVEDFFGHQQYGIASNRNLAEDYHVGDVVLIADGISDAQAQVLQIVADTDDQRVLRVTTFEAPPQGWKIEYARPLPEVEDPHAPGRFSFGGCYLRKFRPAGTPHFYWGRIDKEWDIARHYNRRLVVNFTDAPGDLAVDGRMWTYPKDYAQYHYVVQQYTTHLIERYGDACLDFIWSVGNEPDLASAFWRSGDWSELQKFYDYTVDAVLRSFEDQGYDSQRVIVGGLEIGAIFGTHIDEPILRKFLYHCSPTVTCEGALEYNAAVSDSRLDGRRSQRVEELCRTSGGRGSPCDFISVHSYNAAPLMAAKLRRAKELALTIDAEYYAGLWVSSFESCPDWAPPPDPAAADSYLGNGYFETWCADVSRRRLADAVADARYGFGETILTFWPWPNSNFRGHNNATQVIAIDEDGDGQPDREETLALPILNFLGLLSQMQDRYWVLPPQVVGGHVACGFASRADAALHALLYTHDPADVQARCGTEFDAILQLAGLPWQKVRIREYRFDKDHNSYFHSARQLRDGPAAADGPRRPTAEEVEQLLAGLSSEDRTTQLAALDQASVFGNLPEAVLSAAFTLYQRTEDVAVRAAIEEAGRRMLARPMVFRPEQIAPIRDLAQLRVTRQSTARADQDGVLRISAAIAANGANFLTIEPLDEIGAAEDTADSFER